MIRLDARVPEPPLPQASAAAGEVLSAVRPEGEAGWAAVAADLCDRIADLSRGTVTSANGGNSLTQPSTGRRILRKGRVAADATSHGTTKRTTLKICFGRYFTSVAQLNLESS
ncbi:MAG TPA: hypothetical protein VGB55_04570 [Tepidisphaeraceae bacterium]|jgi:hypothetical protein